MGLGSLLTLIITNLYYICNMFLLLFLSWQALTEMVYQDPQSLDLKPISGGASNQNYLLSYEGHDYFVRCAPPNASLLGADITLENEVLELLKGHSIAPEPIYFNPERRILVTEYIPQEGAPVDLNDRETRKAVFNILHQLDGLNLHISRHYTPYKYIKQLIALLHQLGGSLSPDFTESLPLLKKIDKELSQLSQSHLCHRDLHHDNIMRGDKGLVLIDWEYAVMSHPFATLASMATTEEWDDNKMWEILCDYMESPTQEDFRHLYLYRILADSYWYVWTCLQIQLNAIDCDRYPAWEASYRNNALTRLHSL